MSNRVRLGDIAKIYSGGTPSRTNLALWGGTIPWIGTTQIQNCLITEVDVAEWITDEGLKKSSAKIVPKGSILMAMIGQGRTRGQVAILDIDATTNQNAATIELHANHDKGYVYQQLLFRYEEIRNFSNSSGQQNLNLEIIKSIMIPSFPLREQIAIASLLYIWDTAIEKIERLIAMKEKRFKWLIKSLISDQSHRWEHLAARKIFASISMKNHPDEELLSVTQDNGAIPRNMLNGRVMSPEGSTSSYKLVEKGDFIISLRSFQGGIEHSDYKGLVSPAYTVLRNRVPIYHEFYKLFFKSYLFIEKYLRIAVIGIRDGKQISFPDFESVKIPYPPIEKQKEIASILNTAQQEINLLKKQAEALRKQKRGLMQQLLTGQWRIKN